MDVSGGCLARKMGLPIKLVAAVNSNDFMVRLLETGVYAADRSVLQSLAPAMDIQVSVSNSQQEV